MIICSIALVIAITAIYWLITCRSSALPCGLRIHTRFFLGHDPFHLLVEEQLLTVGLVFFVTHLGHMMAIYLVVANALSSVSTLCRCNLFFRGIIDSFWGCVWSLLCWPLILLIHARGRDIVVSVGGNAREFVTIQALEHCMVLLAAPTAVSHVSYVVADGCIRFKATTDLANARKGLFL